MYLFKATLLLDCFDDLNVSFPSAMSPIIQLVTDIPLQDWKSYMTYRLISSNASVLPEEIDNENFDFYSTVVNGVPQQRERWERGVGRVGSLNSLGEAVGQVYVDRHFPESAKRQMEDLVENLRAALAESIAGLEWMGAETKLEANLKLNSFRPKIAYPDEWTDLSAIEINEASHKFDGIEAIGPDGTVIFSDQAVEIMSKELCYHCQQLPPSEIEGRASELLERFREYAGRHGISTL